MTAPSEPLSAVPDEPAPLTDAERIKLLESSLASLVGTVESQAATVARLKEVVSQLMAQQTVRAMGPQLEDAIRAKVSAAIDGSMPQPGPEPVRQ